MNKSPETIFVIILIAILLIPAYLYDYYKIGCLGHCLQFRIEDN